MTAWYEKNINCLIGKPYSAYLLSKLEQVEPECFLPPDFNSQQYIELTCQYNGLHNYEELRSVVFLGFEIGLITQYLVEKCLDVTNFIIMDTDLTKVKYTLQHYDCRAILSNPRIILAMDDEKTLKQKLEVLFSINNAVFLSNRIHYVDQLIYKDINPKYTNQLKQLFINARQGFMGLLGNNADDTIKGIGNIFRNVRNITESFPLESLKDKYKNIPAICVAAGPSLAKNIAILKQMQGHAIIISCDTIAEKLIKEGIQPDFISSLERDETVYDSFYRGKTFAKTTCFVGLSLVDSRIFQEFEGPKAVVSPPGMPIDNWLKETIPNMTFMHTGKSVAHLNYSLAARLGCDPIVLIGQDLAYGNEGDSHVSGTYDVNPIFQNKPSVHSLENKFLVPGFYGEPVWSNRWWVMFRQWFEDMIPITPNKVINATEGGAYIEGAEHMSLQSVFETYCTSKINIELPHQITYRKESHEYANIADALGMKIKVLNEINKRQFRGLEKLLNKVKWLLNEKHWINNRMKVLNKISEMDQELISTLLLDRSLYQTVQFSGFQYKSKMNRLVELSEFSHVRLVYDYLKEFISNAMHYSGKVAELYHLFENEVSLMAQTYREEQVK